MREVWGWDFGDLSTADGPCAPAAGQGRGGSGRLRLIQTVWVGHPFEEPTPHEAPTPHEEAV